MSHPILTWKIGGEAGFGIMTTGLMLSKVFNRAGLNIFDTIEYPSLIRGGHNTYQITTSAEPLHSQHSTVDILVALNPQTITIHTPELAPGAVVIYDGEKIDASQLDLNATLVSVPLNRLAREVGKNPLDRNTVSLGATMAIVGLEMHYLTEIITETFGHKNQVIAQDNIAAAQAGYDAVVAQNISFTHRLRPTNRAPQMIITGNEAIGLGAIAAGLKLYSAYPMTPASSIMHFLASVQDDYSFVVKHVEDEISAINMAIGGSYAGVRAMTASSGGGFALMVEGYSLASMTETPLVIAEVMRPGPATGLPTWTGQEDLQFVLHAGHGEFPRVVIAPGDTEECFFLTQEAFNLADKYQMPVMIISDLYLAENHQSTIDLSTKVVPIDRGALMTAREAAAATEYHRYAVTKSGISPRKVPGQGGGVFIANSDEHDEYGFSSDDAQNRITQADKRARKIENLLDHVLPLKLHGSKDADVTIVCFGSTKRPALEAIKMLRDEGIEANVLQVIYMAPFPAQQFLDIVRGAKHLLVAEATQSGQFAQLIHEHTKVDIKHRFLKYDGRAINPEELVTAVKKELTHGR